MKQYKIAVCGRKGGVGKTTTAACLGSLLASKGFKCLILDLDPQSNAGFVLGIDPVAPGVAELLLGAKPQPLEAATNLYVLPGGPNLLGRNVESLDPEDLADITDAMDYKVVIFDCPPGTDFLERFGVVAADIALICTTAHPLGIVGAKRVLAEVEIRHKKGRKGPERWAFVLTQINRSRVFDRMLPEQLAQEHPEVPRLLIGQNADLSWATAQGQPFMEASPNAKSVSDFAKVANWVLTNELEVKNGKKA